MSDFVRNVLRRGAGLAPVVAPRPAPAEVTWLEPLVQTEAPALSEPAAAPARTAVQTTGNVHREAAQVAVAAGAPAIGQRLPAPAAQRREPAHGRTSPDLLARPAVVPASHSPEATAAEAPIPQPGLSAGHGLVVRARADVPHHLEVVTRAVDVGAVLPEPGPMPPASARPRIVARQQSVEAAPAGVSPAPEPRIAALHAPEPVAPTMAQPVPPRSAAAEPATPAVQVSIGRIEFAQVPPAPASSRRAPAGFAHRALERRYLDRRWY